MSFVPYAVSWNITSRCNLACSHCYIDANGRESGSADEISTSKALEIVSQIAEVNPGAVLILTGGEPLAREDVYDIISKAAGLGMMVVLGTNGTLLTAEVAGRLAKAGLSGVGVSVDSLVPEKHDTFRGAPGALKSAMEGLAAAKEAGLSVQVQTTPTSGALDQIPLIAEWAHRIGAKVFNLFFLVCTGRGETMADITADEYEQVLKWAATERDSYPGMMIRPKCAPHFKRILHQENPETHLLETYIAACRAGTHYCRIDPAGKVTPCPYMDNVAGDLNESGFGEVWNGSEVFGRYRAPEYEGKCGRCAYRLLCGGCRARALATLGDDMGEDMWCVYEPDGDEEAIVNIDTMAKFEQRKPSGIKWTEEAEAALEKIPFFARSIVRMAVEKKAAQNGAELITSEVMKSAAPAPPPMFGRKDDAEADTPAGSEEIPWDEDARARVDNAPDFVRPGILKLMQRRAAARGKKRIDSQFLTEIRDESMMLVTKRMKKMGFAEIDMKAWDKASAGFSGNQRKVDVIGQIKSFLGARPEKNRVIMEKFGSFFADDVGKKMGWTKEARDRLSRAPAFARGMATKAVEKHAREHGYKYVTLEAVQEAMAASPSGKFAAPPDGGE